MAYFRLFLNVRNRAKNTVIIYHPEPTLDALLRMHVEDNFGGWLRATEHRQLRDKSGKTRWAHNETAIAIADIVSINAIAPPAAETVAAPVEAIATPEERPAA